MTRPESFDADPFGTLRTALWIGGAQWAGKSTVARILAARYGLTAYHADFPAIHGHRDRQAAARARATGAPFADLPVPAWLASTPAELADECLATFAEHLPYVFDDLRALVSPHPILAEGWSLRPDALAPLLEDSTRMLVVLPTEEFREHQIRTLPRAGAVSAPTADPARAQKNRLERDRILADHARRSACEHGVRVLDVDGSRDAEAVADEVADHFAAHLPPLAPLG